MLTRGNSKLGRSGRIWGFGLPSLVTCPGRTETCSSHCYSARIEARRPSVRRRYERNLVLSRQTDFAERVCRFIERRRIEVVRVHTAGDFDSSLYARRWFAVMRRLPTVRFYLYTRSWRVPSIRRVLGAMAGLPNVRVWFSVDADTGSPGRVPIGVRLAWLMTRHDETPARADLVFRTQALRRSVHKRMGTTKGASALVCPTENGITGHRTDCERCGVCWQSATQAQEDTNRIGLPIIR